MRRAAVAAAAPVAVANVHPAVWIASWCVYAILVQRLGLSWLGAVAVPTAGVVAMLAAPHAVRLLRRARWLLLAIAVLFVVATPGERLPGPAGAAGLTVDGLLLAAEHLLRLVLLLATLGLLLGLLGRAGLLAGLHCLLAPLGVRRDRLVVRLLLALEYVDGDERPQGWRDWLDGRLVPGPERLSLHVPHLRRIERAALALLAVAALAVILA